jgi:hypothetical protein
MQSYILGNEDMDPHEASIIVSHKEPLESYETIQTNTATLITL